MRQRWYCWTRWFLVKQHFCKTLLSVHNETVPNSTPFWAWQLFYCFYLFVCFCLTFFFFSPCDIPTDWFQRKASVTFGAELERSRATAILCFWYRFPLVYLPLLWVSVKDFPHPSCSWIFYFFCWENNWNKINLKFQPDCRGKHTTELGSAVSCNAWWFAISFFIVKIFIGKVLKCWQACPKWGH